MSDLVITSRPLLTHLLVQVEPFVVFKKEHVRRALWLLPQITKDISAEKFLKVAHEVDAFAALNYSKKKLYFAADVERHLQSKGLLAPVTTEAERPRRKSWLKSQIYDSATRRPLERG